MVVKVDSLELSRLCLETWFAILMLFIRKCYKSSLTSLLLQSNLSFSLLALNKWACLNKWALNKQLHLDPEEYSTVPWCIYG